MFSKEFPKLEEEGYHITSPQTPSYNCIAWALGDNQRWWWPDPFRQAFWPLSVDRSETVEAFIECFESLGYYICESSKIENGYQKIALYTNDDGSPTHASRQLLSGKWTSKLGGNHDIEHTLSGLISETYGKVEKIFKKPIE